MKKKILIAACAVMGAMGLMSMASNSLSSSVDREVLSAAHSAGCISEAEYDKLSNVNATERCLEALQSDGLQGAVDEAATIAVEQGYAKSKADAKRIMKAEAEKVRKNDSLCQKIYDLLGL